jgi:hypothetical protein
MKIVELYWRVESTFSPKVIEESQKWMREQSFWLETLTPEQQNAVHRLTESRLGFKKNIGKAVFQLVGMIVVAYFLANFLDQKFSEIAPASQTPTSEGNLMVGLKEARTYGNVCAIVGLCVGMPLGIAMHMVFSLMTEFWTITIHRKTLLAFLPATKRLS